MLLKDAVYMTQPVYREHRVNSVEANQFNSNIGSSLLEDGVYTAQSVYSKRRVNLVKANNLNGHVGSSLLEDGVYKAKSVYLECRVNSLQEKTLNGHVESSLQDELLRSQNLSYQLLAESFMPLRTSTLTPNRQTNPLNVSNLQYNNSLQPRSSMLSNPSLSKLPHDQQASTQLLMPCLSNLDLYNSKLSESSISQTLQQQKGLLNQPARAIPIYPLSRTRTGTGTGPPFQALSSIHYFRM
ncbi:hypothetical protein ES288_D08G144200v1 [Gossypium darwinii]|uniref:Uncharacterized protein n=1 Tax=Gossypium darwinii TaxID=34276 RepID=A0A5D2BP41_GOSDA|nr:hypothetical protein ES288_D08G144200v1 [Gossypium darwinii]